MNPFDLLGNLFQGLFGGLDGLIGNIFGQQPQMRRPQAARRKAGISAGVTSVRQPSFGVLKNSSKKPP